MGYRGPYTDDGPTRLIGQKNGIWYGWLPFEIAGLQRWWRRGRELTGDPVTSWIDLENGANLVPGNAPARGEVFGLPVPDFDGTNDALTIAASTADYNYQHNGAGGWFACVARSDGGAGQRAFFSTGDDQIAEVGTYYGRDGANNGNWRITNGLGVGYVITLNTTSAPYTAGNVVVAIATFSLGDVPDASLYINGTLEASGDVGQAPSAANATNNLSVGARNAGASRPQQGPIAELLFGSGTLSSADRALLTSYLVGLYRV